MVKSMTGYGRAEEVLHGRKLGVEVKSVNSRYFEYTARMPRNLGFLEDPLKRMVSQHAARGKVEVYISVQNIEAGEEEISANLPAARGYYHALEEISEALGIQSDITASVLGRFSDVFTIQKATQDEEEIQADILHVLGKALEKYDAMRAVEGENLLADITARLATLAGTVAKVEKDSAGRAQRYTTKLYDRLKELLADTTVDESRMLTEAAVFADKTAVDEETVRLKSHLEQFGGIMTGGGAVGRKLDFLTQELNREVNTIGSKCQEVDITRMVVDMKAEVEKIREQIQNLE